MPNPGQANNALGINAFSGPMGETEPAYGQVERDMALESAAPVGSPSPAAVPKRAQRRAVSGRAGSGAPARSAAMHPDAVTNSSPQIQQQMFWQAVLNDPGASPLARQYAEQALGAPGQ